MPRDVAAFSRHHFHRQFSGFLGMSAYRYVQFMRMRRASWRLAFRAGMSVNHIAFATGYESPEAFARAFRQFSGQSPSEFRAAPDWCGWHSRLSFTHLSSSHEHLSPAQWFACFVSVTALHARTLGTRCDRRNPSPFIDCAPNPPPQCHLQPCSTTIRTKRRQINSALVFVHYRTPVVPMTRRPAHVLPAGAVRCPSRLVIRSPRHSSGICTRTGCRASISCVTFRVHATVAFYPDVPDTEPSPILSPLR